MSSLSRFRYRFHQFRLAFFGPREEVPDGALSPYLSEALILLFRRMLPSEQAHSFQVLNRLRSGGHEDADLLAAALLHDVGKVRSPLSVWDRSLIVVGKRFFPRATRDWGRGEPRGLRRPFVVAAWHAEWGAELAEQAGARPRTIELIRHHQDDPSTQDPQLAALQQADGSE